MKRIFTIIWVVGSLLTFSAGRAAAFSHYSENEFITGESLDPGMSQMGVDVSWGDDFTSFYPEVRYGLGAMFEVGAKFGAVAASTDSGNKLGALVGADLKYQLVKETEGVPIDLSVDLGFNNTLITHKNATELTFATVASKNFPLTDRGYAIVPYGGLAMSALYGSLPSSNSTYMNAFAGLEWKITRNFMALLEIKAGESTVGGVGIRIEY